MEKLKICYNNMNLVVISQYSFHHSTILGIPEDSAVDLPPEGTEAILALASLKTLKMIIKWRSVERESA